jgi:CheY-like chemotaxis protein
MVNPDNTPKTILLADDDIDDRELFEDIVKEINPSISVRCVPDGTELMRTLRSSNVIPDLLFLDLNMPGKNGKECLREIRANNGLKNLKVIIYSTSSLAQDIYDTHGFGANLFLKKPSSYNVALDSLRKILSMDIRVLPDRPDLAAYTFTPEKI